MEKLERKLFLDYFYVDRCYYFEKILDKKHDVYLHGVFSGLFFYLGASQSLLNYKQLSKKF